ncbi:MAG: DASS family sodium-coupled anion symporter [Planctomycetota bacterium]
MASTRRRTSQFVAAGISGVMVLAAATGSLGGLGMEPQTQVGLAILVIAAVLWITEAVPLFLTSFIILGLSLTWLTRVMPETPPGAEFLSPFFSNIILLFLGGFTLSAALHKQKLDERMARWVIQRTGGSLPMLVLGLMLITAFLSMWLSNTATAAMVLALCIPITRGMPEGDPARKAILLAVPFAANIGGVGTPIGSPPNAIALQYLKGIGAAPDFLTWMLMGVPFAIVMLAVAWVVLLFLFCRGAKHEPVKLDPITAPVSSAAWITLGITLFTMTGWLTGSLHGFSSGTVALVPVLLLFGSGLLNNADFRGLSWDVLFVMGGGLCLGVVVADSGLAAWLVERLPTDGVSLATLAILTGVLACGMSTVMSNTATANLILPIVVGLGLATPSPVLLGVAFCCSMAMALPISTPPNAIAFSSGVIHSRDLLGPGLIITVIGVVAIYTLGMAWWDLLGVVPGPVVAGPEVSAVVGP